jgi:hypothetical protein
LVWLINEYMLPLYEDGTQTRDEQKMHTPNSFNMESTIGTSKCTEGPSH